MKLKLKLYGLIPAQLRFKLINFLHSFDHFKQTHYSQNGEDIILLAMFPKNYHGLYVDVGAHHPYRLSNTYQLFKKGWRGINIDANPETIDLFRKARPNDINLNIGVGKNSSILPFHRFADPAVNTFSSVEAERWKQKKWNTYLGTVDVAIKPLAAILNEHLFESVSIDVLDIDVEGLDLEVLESNDWQLFRPRVIVVEDHHFDLNKPTNSSVYTYLLEQGYKLEHKAKFSLIFKDKQREQ